MTTNWMILADWNRDGFYCRAADGADYGRLNLLPTPMTWDGLTFPDTPDIGGSTIEVLEQTTNYGIRVARLENDDTPGSLYVGAKASGGAITAVDEISVQPNTTYTFRFWTRRISASAGSVFSALLIDNNGATLGSVSTKLATQWHPVSVTFTTAANSTHIYFRFSGPWFVIVEVTGMALFAGSNALGDPLNLMPTPITFNDVDFSGVSGASVTLTGSISDYGLKVFDVQTGTNTAAGLYIGYPVGSLPVLASSPYTGVIWIRGVSGYSGVDLYFRLRDQGLNNLSSLVPFTLTDEWQPISASGTTLSGSNSVFFAVCKNGSAADMRFEVAGPMLVVGSVAPVGYNTGNITDYYDVLPPQSANWFVGQRRPYQELADDSMLELVLDNHDRLLSPENTSGPLYGVLKPFKRVQIESDDGSTRRIHWLGWIESIQPDVNVNSARRVKINAAGAMQFYKRTQTGLALQENQRTDQIIDALVQQVIIPPASLEDIWVLGRVGNSELADTTRLVKTAQDRVLDEGEITLAIAGDNWVRQGGMAGNTDDTFDVYRAIWDVVGAERGRFLFTRDGQALFWNRSHLEEITTDDATFDNSMNDLTYTYANGDEFHNEVIVACHPRSISETADEVLWTLDGEFRVPAGQIRSFEVKYKADDGVRVGGRNVTLTDVVFSQGEAVISIDLLATGAKLTLDNAADKETQAILSGLTIRGEKITDFGVMEAIKRNQTSILEHGVRTLRMSLPAVDNFDDAEDIAAFELARRKDPRGSIRTMTLRSHGMDGGGHHANQLALTLGDRIGVQESQTGHDGSYFIIGEAHRLSDGAELMETTWYLESV